MRTRTKRGICAWAALGGLAFALGAVGGIERQGVPLGAGLLMAAAGLAVFCAAAWKGGWLR